MQWASVKAVKFEIFLVHSDRISEENSLQFRGVE